MSGSKFGFVPGPYLGKRPLCSRRQSNGEAKSWYLSLHYERHASPPPSSCPSMLLSRAKRGQRSAAEGKELACYTGSDSSSRAKRSIPFGLHSASGAVRTNRFRAEGLELADREGEKNKVVATIESIRCSSMDKALSFASHAKCDERLVFRSLCTLSREPLFRERLAPLLREGKLIFPPLLGSSSATGLCLLRKVRFLPNSVREGTKKEYDGMKDQGEKEECTESKVKHQTRVVVSCCIFAFMVCSIITSSGGISLGIRWGRIHSSHFVKWGPTVSISLRVVPLPYHSFYFNKESRSVAKNGNYSGPGQLLVEGAARSSSGGQTLICCFTPSWAANYKLFPTGRRDAMIHVVVKQEMPGRSKIGPSHNTPAAVATMKKENDDPSPQPTMTHLSAAHRTTNNQVGHTQAWNNTPPDPWSADASGNWIIIEFGRVMKLPSALTKVLAESADLFQDIIEGKSGHGKTDPMLALRKHMIDAAESEIDSGSQGVLKKRSEEDRKAWLSCLQRIWALGPRRVGPNILLVPNSMTLGRNIEGSGGVSNGNGFGMEPVLVRGFPLISEKLGLVEVSDEESKKSASTIKVTLLGKHFSRPIFCADEPMWVLSLLMEAYMISGEE
eukprot:Gb_28597 [translate_table: standard]